MRNKQREMKNLKAEVALDLLPETGFPAIDIKLIRIKRRDWHGRIRSNDLIGRNILRSQVQPALLLLTSFCQPINRQT
jgi:hypothetical protein